MQEQETIEIGLVPISKSSVIRSDDSREWYQNTFDQNDCRGQTIGEDQNERVAEVK